MIRYTILRLLIFIACAIALWLAGLRGEENLLLLVVGAALASMVISYFLLRPMREQFSDEVAHKVEERTRAKREKQSRPSAPRAGSDEAVEDQGIDDSFR